MRCNRCGGVSFDDGRREVTGDGEGRVFQCLDCGAMNNFSAPRQPRVVRCVNCGAQVECVDSLLNPCMICGADYDGSGTLLAPRDRWGVG